MATKSTDVPSELPSDRRTSLQHRYSLQLVLISCIVLVGLTGVLFAIMQFGKNTKVSEKMIQKPKYSLSPKPTSIITLPANSNEQTRRDAVDPPEKYGFTKTISLEGIGVSAQFPPNVRVSLEANNLYVVSANESDQVTFKLKPYDGGGRRAWFQKEYPWASAYQTESFVGEGHSGYLAYAVREADIPGSFFYFTVIGEKMLVVSGANVISNNLNPSAGNTSIFFTNDITKFKSFLSGIEIVTPKVTEVETFPKMSDLFRWSDTRKTVWQDVDLGLKVIAPEWTESRFTRGRDAEGKFIYSDWTRTYPEAKTDPISYLSDTVLRTQVTGGYMSSQFLTQLPARFQGKTFTEVAHEALIAGGFCATEWKNSKDDCENQNYCYTRDEVVQHLTMNKQIKMGSLDAQLRGMDRDFSILNDCRSEDVWLMHGANGQYVTSEISPDADAIRLESL